MTALSAIDRHGVAVALGEMLAEMQKLRGPFAGRFGSDVALKPFAGGYTAHVIAMIEDMIAAAHPEALTKDDKHWMEDVAAQAQAVAGVARPHTFVHGDYKLGNLTVLKTDHQWRVSGLFDLHTAHFGDGAADVSRVACSYLDSEKQQAKSFLDAYRTAAPPDPTFGERLPLYVVMERLAIWSYFAKPPNRPDWAKNMTFRGWAQRYVDALLKLL